MMEHLELRCLLSGSSLPTTAIDLPLDPNVQRAGWIAQPGGQDQYRVTLDGAGRLVAYVHATGFDTRLSLLDGQGDVLIQSEATSPSIPTTRSTSTCRPVPTTSR
ncbi:MAG TPA: hypothetical protein VGZ22_11210 [Isosphaeraceae bacterium]|nr:hypothetical protein [Isosphaeraceae bacterium]